MSRSSPTADTTAVSSWGTCVGGGTTPAFRSGGRKHGASGRDSPGKSVSKKPETDSRPSTSTAAGSRAPPANAFSVAVVRPSREASLMSARREACAVFIYGAKTTSSSATRSTQPRRTSGSFSEASSAWALREGSRTERPSSLPSRRLFLRCGASFNPSSPTCLHSASHPASRNPAPQILNSLSRERQ